jgi:hypothetical protein
MMEMAKGLYVSLSAIGYQNIWISTFVNILEDTQTHYYNFFGKVQKKYISKTICIKKYTWYFKIIYQIKSGKKGYCKILINSH